MICIFVSLCVALTHTLAEFMQNAYWFVCSAVLRLHGYQSSCVLLALIILRTFPVKTLLCRFSVENAENEYLRFALHESLPALAHYA